MTVEGFIRSSNNLTPSGDCTASIRQQIRTMNPKAKKAILYTTTFSLIYILAQGNPKVFQGYLLQKKNNKIKIKIKIINNK